MSVGAWGYDGSALSALRGRRLLRLRPGARISHRQPLRMQAADAAVAHPPHPETKTARGHDVAPGRVLRQLGGYETPPRPPPRGDPPGTGPQLPRPAAP